MREPPGHGLYFFYLFMGLAPPLLLLFNDDTTLPDTVTLGDYNYFSAYYSGGAFGSDDVGGLSHWGNVQVLHKGLYAEYRVEKFGAASHVQFQTIRGGYLLNSRLGTVPRVAAGVTVGYRRAQGPNVHNAVEVALPLILRSERGAGARFEPSYLFWGKSARYGYRLDFNLPVGRTPFAAGMTIEVKQLRPGRKYVNSLTFQLGFEL